MDLEKRNLPQTVRWKRRDRNMTQSELAELVGCRQSAVSMYEAEKPSKLSRKNVERIAEILEIDLSAFPVEREREEQATRLSLKYCPIDTCLSNIPYAVHGSLHFKPTMIRGEGVSKSRCTCCGEVMESTCPNPDCRAELVEGAVCPRCATPYVTTTVEVAGWAAVQWAAEQRAMIREVREMSQTGNVAGGA
ncbi:helix-turn-helix domain-containing protein [Verrucomicrobiota bacterium]